MLALLPSCIAAAGLRACVRKLDVNCKATRPKCWVSPTAYLKDAIHAIDAELHRRGLAPATGGCNDLMRVLPVV